MGVGRRRYAICLLVSLGMALVYAMRFNLSVAIISMAGSKGTVGGEHDREGTCAAGNNNGTEPVDGEFKWDSHLEPWVLNGFFVGYISTQILGGLLADHFSVKWVLGYGIFCTSALTVSTHWVARLLGVYPLIGLRVLEGITEGVTFPAVYCLIARWAPKPEKTTMLMLSLMGASIGTVVTMPVAAALCQSSLGWPASFYIPGLLGVVWSLLWWFCATSQPENCRWISDGEREYIVSHRGAIKNTTKTVPWKSILTSRAVWVLSISRLCTSVPFYVFMTEMPTYVDNIFHIPMTRNGYLNGFFSVCYASSLLASGWFSDVLLRRKGMSRTNIRKLFECSSLAISGIMLLIVPLLGCNWSGVAVALCVASISIALVGGGDTAMPLDLAPNYAGFIMGVVNTAGNCAGVVVPLLVGHMTAGDNHTIAAWNNVFYVTAGVCFAGATLFALLSSAEEQPWATSQEDETEIVSSGTN